MLKVDVIYYLMFTDGDISEGIREQIELNAEEAAAYLDAMKKCVPFEEYPVLAAALKRAYSRIKAEELAADDCADTEADWWDLCLAFAEDPEYAGERLYA